ARFICARLCRNDDRAAGPDLYVLRRLAAGAAARRRGCAAERRAQQSAGGDGGGSGSARCHRGASSGREPSSADGRICRARRERFRSSRGAGRGPGAAVFDVHARLNFPNRHPLNLSCHKEIFRDADLIVSLDTRDWEKSTHFIERTERRVTPYYPPHCEMIEIGFGEINLSKWSMDYTRMPAC